MHQLRGTLPHSPHPGDTAGAGRVDSVPEQPLVQSTDEKPSGPLTLRVYPPTAPGADCEGSLYLDDGVSYDFKKGDYLRVQFACRLTAQGMIVTVAPRKGTFQPWWKLLEIEVYGASKPYASAMVTGLDHPGLLRSRPTSMRSIIA